MESYIIQIASSRGMQANLRVGNISVCQQETRQLHKSRAYNILYHQNINPLVSAGYDLLLVTKYSVHRFPCIQRGWWIYNFHLFARGLAL
jgi:hypothetical protein